MGHDASAVVLLIKNYAQNCARTSLGNHSCVARYLTNTSFFLEATRCLALIPSESRDSGHDSSLDAKVKLAVFSACPNDFSGRVWRGPRFEIRADYGRFLELSLVSSTALAFFRPA